MKLSQIPDELNSDIYGIWSVIHALYTRGLAADQALVFILTPIRIHCHCDKSINAQQRGNRSSTLVNSTVNDLISPISFY